LRKDARKLRTFGVALCLGVLLAAAAARAANADGQQTSANLTLRATISPDGSYEISFRDVDWRLDGKLPDAPATIHASRGRDALGEYEQISATYRDGARKAQIRVYKNVPVALLEDAYVRAGPNENPFPTFASLPPGLMKFSYQQKVFGVYEFGALGPEGPWSLFDQQGNVWMLSPADHFEVSRMDELDGGAADSRIIRTIQTLPAGFTHGTLIAFAKGMNHTFTIWGNALLALGGKERPANDANVLLAKFGYWTDRGAFYYYHFDPRYGYAGTLLALRDEFQKLDLPLGYMQLDSWWYPKGDNQRWNSPGSTLAYGEDTYRADKELFPKGLSAFHESLGLPLVTHARWISTSSSYRKEYKMSGNVVIDPAFWNSTADYLADAGVVTYEQDWLNHNAQPEMNLRDPQAFLGDMSKAMLGKNITIEYCMPLPSDYMASTLYPNVQTTRVSDDRFERARWDAFLYDSRLASAVGLWPWTDVFFSGELPNLLISTLSAGPVGVGDELGGTNAQNIAGAIRRDMVIVKPDTPLLPVDAMYASDARNPGAPMVAMATTDFANDTVRYVFAYPRNETDQSVTVPLDELGAAGPVFAYDWLKHTGQLIPAGGTLGMKFQDGWDYQIVSPVNRKGLALLGDTANFVSMGKQRVRALEDKGALSATVRFAPGEEALTIAGYASHRPNVKSREGKVKAVSYNSQSGIFELSVSPGKAGKAILRISAH
jgi:hypothetical protein